MTRVVFCASGTNPEPWVAKLASLLPEAEVVAWQADDTVQADFAVVWAPPPALFDTQQQLRGIFNLGAGVDGLMRLPNLPRDVPVIRLGDAGMSVQMAEYVCHAVVRHARELDHFEADMGLGNWTFRKPTQRQDYPVGVMGLGAIGARVAQALSAFEFPVFGWSRSAKSLPGVECFHGDAGLAEFLPKVRVLVCVLPLTPETENILNLKHLSQLQRGAYLINVARGAHLVEADLLTLLDSGQLAGATLDVFRVEPLPKGHPFWGRRDIVMTPHISARTQRDDSLAQIAGKIRQAADGDTSVLAGVVDPSRGY